MRWADKCNSSTICPFAIRDSTQLVAFWLYSYINAKFLLACHCRLYPLFVDTFMYASNTTCFLDSVNFCVCSQHHSSLLCYHKTYCMYFQIWTLSTANWLQADSFLLPFYQWGPEVTSDCHIWCSSSKQLFQRQQDSNFIVHSHSKITPIFPSVTKHCWRDMPYNIKHLRLTVMLSTDTV